MAEKKVATTITLGEKDAAIVLREGGKADVYIRTLEKGQALADQEILVIAIVHKINDPCWSAALIKSVLAEAKGEGER